MKYLKKLIIFSVVTIVTLIILFNCYIGYSLYGIEGIFGIHLQLPNYIKEGQFEYQSDNINLKLIIPDKEFVDGHYYIGDCYFNNTLKVSDYEYYEFTINYWDSRSGKIFIIGHNEEVDNKPAFDVGGNTVFVGDFKFKWNGDLECYNLNDDNGFWGGSKDILLRKVVNQ